MVEKNPQSEKKVTESGSKSPGMVIGLLFLLAAVVFCLWYFVLSENSDVSQSPLASKSDQTLSSALVGEDGAEFPLLEARRLITEKAEIQVLEAALERFEALAGAEDAVFILVRFLAPHAVKHQLRYASFYDPTDTRPTGSVVKNGSIAFAEYTLAIKAGEEKALEAQRKILEWARNNSDSGRADVDALLKKTGVH